ncbi:hypothetical protein GCM10009850_120920 [Nonomuraea monospora]|uniref:Uncharacterized protein n=1 Tax=Nonomuraea monospora TaxID=568818 RepID=A0ABN3D5J6_9ACTN
MPIFPESATFDFECEVAVVIGRAGRDLTLEEARGHLARDGHQHHGGRERAVARTRRADSQTGPAH